MMNKNFLFIALFLFCTAYAATAQVDTIRLRGDGSRPKIVTDRPPQAVYFQVLGSGPILSVMYDRRLGKKVNGLGFAVGLGYWGEDGDNIFSIPVQLNYLFGRQTHFIELAGGTTYVTAAESFFLILSHLDLFTTLILAIGINLQKAAFSLEADTALYFTTGRMLPPFILDLDTTFNSP